MAKALTDTISPIARRIRKLANNIWEGNISQMSRALQISHPVLSRVLRGKQEPPASLLLAIARWPKVNLRWFFLGEGHDTIGGRDLTRDGGKYCPVSHHLLPGPPKDYPHLLYDTSLPVADAYFSETAYWYLVAHDCKIVANEAEKVRDGDWLLIETGQEPLRRVERLYGHLITVRIGSKIMLGRLGWGEDNPIQAPDEFPLQLFGKAGKTILLTKPLDAVISPIEMGERASKKRPQYVEMTNVVGACIVIQRSGFR
ncbi:MAG: helix-turn-helix transcriptional regulator [Planctomycetes bacterium]|nr:helix-turn-helix transcriptional regulator [Planctomycetota bacterium]